MAASNAVIMNETMLMLTTVNNFNRNLTTFTKMIYDGLGNVSGIDTGTSSNAAYSSQNKQVTGTGSGTIVLSMIPCTTTVSAVVISLGIISGAFTIKVRRNTTDAWITAAENEWIDLANQTAGTNLYIKLEFTTTSVLNAYSVCWV